MLLQSTVLLQKKKKMQEVQQELDRKKVEYEQRMRKVHFRNPHSRFTVDAGPHKNTPWYLMPTGAGLHAVPLGPLRVKLDLRTVVINEYMRQTQLL